MDINQNNAQKNVFSGGMDLDTSSTNISSDKYRIARNVHYITDKESNSGELHIINGVQKSITGNVRYANKTILGTASVQEWGVIIYKNNDQSWGVDKFQNPYENDIPTDTSTKDFNFTPVISNCPETIGNKYKNKLSCILNYESEDNIKLYIADGEHYLLVINIAKTYPNPTDIGLLEAVPRIALNPIKIVDIVDGSIENPVVQYSYQVYSRYGQQSEVSPITRLLSLPSNKIDYNKDGKSVEGVAPEKSTNCGVRLSIDVSNVPNEFDKIKIYRISYQQNGQLPLIELIYDDNYTDMSYVFIDSGMTALSTLTLEEFNSISGQHIIPRIIERKDNMLFAANITEPTFSLKGFDQFDARSYSFDPITRSTHLYSYSTDKCEVFTKNTITNIPIDHDCYNKYTDINTPMYDSSSLSLTTNDVSTGQYDRFDLDGYYGGYGTAISWRFIETELIGDSSLACKNPIYGNAGTMSNTISLNQDKSKIDLNNLMQCYIWKDGELSTPHNPGVSNRIANTAIRTNYSDPLASYLFRSLRRDEVYRFGIVLYDKNGIASPVKWIADIRTPNMSWRGFETFSSHGSNRNYIYSQQQDGSTLNDLGYDLGVRPLGIEFTVNCDKLPDGCTGYEIVRCNRTTSDIATLSQGVLSRPIVTIHGPNYRGIAQGEEADSYSAQSTEPYTPSGFLTTCRYWAGYGSPQSVGFGSMDTYDMYGRARHSTKMEEYDYNESKGLTKEADNLDNSTIYQFVSPEVVYQKDSFQTLIKDVNLKLSTEKYVFGSDGGPVEDRYTDSRFIITPSASNVNLRIMGEDWESLKYVYFFDLTNKKWYSPGDDVKYIRKGLNQRFQIYNDYRFTPYYFYRSRVACIKHNFSYGDKSSAGYMVSISNVDHTNMSTAEKQTYEIINPKPSSLDNGNPNINGYTYWPSAARTMTALIKLYEQSNTVWCRQHMAGRPSVDFVIQSGSNSAVEPNPIEREVQNRTDITDVAFPDDLNWDDFATQTTVDNKVNWSLTYIDKITSIGTKQYCNWATNGAFGHPLDDTKHSMKWNADWNEMSDFGFAKNESGRQALNGPAGRCMLININNNWDRDAEGTYGLLASNSEYYRKTNSFLLSDQIACSKSLQRQTRLGMITSLRETAPTKTQLSMTGPYSQNISIFKNSIFGTYICNLRKTVTPYGGCDYTSRTLNSYYSYGDYNPVVKGTASKLSVYDGDCYIMPMEYTSLYKYYNSYSVYQAVANINYAIPVETNINLAYTYGAEPSRTVYSGNENIEQGNTSYVQAEPANVANKYTQKKPEYSYNTVYSTNSTARVFSAYNPENDQEKFEYRCRHSNAKSQNEDVDSWCKFMPADYIDVDSKFGKISCLQTFHNYMYYWQEQAFGRFSINERAQIVDQNNSSLILGTGGVLDRYDYITEKSGIKMDQLADTTSPTAIYWWDYDGHTIWSSNGQSAIPLSKIKGVQNLLNTCADNKTLIQDPILIYDKCGNDVIMRIVNESNKYSSFVYNEQTETFVAIDDIAPKYQIQFNNCTYLTSLNNLYRWDARFKDVAMGFDNSGLDCQLFPFVQYVVNANPQTTKTFDNVEFGGRFYNGDTYDITMFFNTPLKQNSRLDGKNITNREYSFRFAIPRNNNSMYGDRMKGKFMDCELISNSSNIDFSLQYILSTFRASCS